ncbi:MAG: DUF6089 family protein [Flavobacteriales bacterium]
MNLIRKLLASFLFVVFSSSISANPNINPYSEVGLFGGVGYYLGDLNRNYFPLKIMQQAGGIFYRYTLNEHCAVRAFINYNEVKAYDVYSSNDFERERNLSFTSPIFEVGGQLEFNFYEFALVKSVRRIATPFVFGGINYFYFNPKAYNGSTFINLEPLQTEGVNYSLHQIAIPVGLGIKMKMGRFGFTAEWGIRKTFTDYIDDVSGNYASPGTISTEAEQMSNKTGIPLEKIAGKQRGDSTRKDLYVFTGLTISYKLSKEDHCPDFKSRK